MPPSIPSAVPLMLLVAGLGLFAYTYVGYPALLQFLRVVRRGGRALTNPRKRLATGWRTISVVLPAYNEAEGIAGTLERILAIEYPAERRQILVVSDASTDGTDEIITQFAPRGVELLRLPQRCGKTAAENAARSRLTGEIIVNTDASVRVDAAAVKHLVAAFDDPSVGVASGRDVSVSNVDDRTNPGEQAYVGYDMWVRDLETSLSGIVGASGCLYAIRRDLHMQSMPDGLSRDFGSALVAREHGYRAVSVPAAICYVPRSTSLRREYRRKVRTMARGLRTLWHKRALLNPRRHGLFAWMLWSHKLCRWLVPLTFVPMAVALVALAPGRWWAAATLALGVAATLVTAIGWVWPERRRLPRFIALPAYAVSGNVAALQAWIRALQGQGTAVWEPTRRGVTSHPGDRASRRA
jgi:cellulose synthase/poly-beta-1,6-N-acetylglucosamine synthase-like glycosyltransferase